jgi:hypothetical protein
LPGGEAQAATLIVTNLNASGPGSLQQAVIDAAPGDTITFAVTGTITIPGTGLTIPKDLMIAGPGPNLLTISAGNTNVTLSVLAGATVTMSDVTITQGSTGSCGNGGGINNAGTLMLVNSIVTGNSACAGAGIATVNGGSTTVINSTIIGNNASIRGGGIMNGPGSTTIISGTLITDNSSAGPGGAIQLDGGTTTISQSCIVSNNGGIDVNLSSGMLTAENNWWGVPTGPNTGGETTNVAVGSFLTSAPSCGAVLSTPPETITSDRDSILRSGAKDHNEGVNPLLHLGENRRLVVGFDLSAIDTSSVASAKLVLTINPDNPPGNWGSNGRTVDAHRLLESWTEGNGKAFGLPNSEQTRGSGSGVTWVCAIDIAIENQQADCDLKWNGGNFEAMVTDSVLHVNGMSGEVVWNVTADVQAGFDSWLIKKTQGNGNVRYYSKDHPNVAGNPGLAPRLILEFGP